MKKKENLTRRYLPYRMLAFIAEDKGNSGALYNYKLMIVTLERPSIVKLTRDSVEIHQRLSKDHKYLEKIKESLIKEAKNLFGQERNIIIYYE